MDKIKELRLKGLSYGKISLVLNISLNTVKSFCRRNNLTGYIRNKYSRDCFCLECKNLIKNIKWKIKNFVQIIVDKNGGIKI